MKKRITVPFTKTTFSLKQRAGQWCWFRSDNQRIGPVFDTRQEALCYGQRVPLLTREEWMQR